MIIKSFALIEKNKKFLLIQEANKKWNGKWFLPGGTAKLGESPADAAKREVKEETGYEVSIKGIFYIRYHEKLFNKQISLFYCAKISGGKLKTSVDKHSLQVKWFTRNEIRNLKVRQNLRDILAGYDPEANMPSENFKFYK